MRMASYRRFVAYVYKYQKNRKGANCGFIKVEARNGLCTFYLRFDRFGYHRRDIAYAFFLVKITDIKLYCFLNEFTLRSAIVVFVVYLHILKCFGIQPKRKFYLVCKTDIYRLQPLLKCCVFVSFC